MLPTVSIAKLKTDLGAAPDRSAWRLLPLAGAERDAIAQVSAAVSAAGKCPVVVSPPMGELDTGPVALMQVAACLIERGGVGEALDALRDPSVRWPDKLSLVDAQLTGRAVVLVLERPAHWASRVSGGELYFAERARQVARLMEAQRSPRIILDTWVQGPRANVVMDTQSVLETEGFAGLDDLARDLTRYPNIASVLERSPLEQRLLVGVGYLESPGVAMHLGRGQSALPDLIERLSQGLRGEPHAPLIRAWQRLSLVRGSISEELLQGVLFPDRLDRKQDAFLRHVLLSPTPDGLTMHPAMRHAIARHAALFAAQARDVHQVLTRLYSARLTSAQATPSDVLLASMEAHHHAAAAGDIGLLGDQRVYFVDHLNALGRTLSRDLKDRASAARCFEQSLAWQPDDDYAHHYLAYNLDIQGIEPRRVETHFTTAIELEPSNVWWRSRFIRFLATRARNAEARTAWQEACDLLRPLDANPLFYRELHFRFAALLLHRGQLAQARAVLDDVPETVRGDAGYRALERHFNALDAASRERAVFPISIDPTQWWERPPHILPTKDLMRWFPGRIDYIDDTSVVLVLAEREGDTTRYLRIELTLAELEAANQDAERASTLRAGRFVEVGYYHSAPDQPRLRVHPLLLHSDPDLPKPFPDPARYLKAAAGR